MIDSSRTVFIVDDDAAFRRALARLLSFAGYRTIEFASATEFMQAHDPSVAGCLILDLVMPERDGFEVQTALKAAGCRRPIIFLTGKGSIPLTVLAIRAGAVNLLTKPVGQKQLLAAVGEALRIEASEREQKDQQHCATEKLATLTPRELEVLQHVVCGRLNKQIAGDLGIVEKTIKVHRARVMRKMGARSLAELVRIASRAGVSAPGEPGGTRCLETRSQHHHACSGARREDYGSSQLPFGPMHWMAAGRKAADGGEC